MALQYQLARYAYIYERALVADGYALDNDSGKTQKRNRKGALLFILSDVCI